MGDDDVVHERALGRELVARQHLAGPGVHDTAVACRSTRDEQAPARVDPQAHRRGARAFAEHRTFAGTQVGTVERTVSQRAEVGRRPADRDALGLEAIG
jgi:hypothetical protein